MKTTILIITFFCSACILNSYSQPEKGTYMLGGGASTGIDFYTDNNSFHISLYPDMGYFFTDNLAIGTYLPLSITLQENYRRFGYGLTPFFRYYFGPSSDIMYFVTGAFGISAYSTKYDDTSSSSSGVTAAGGAGGTYFLNESIGLEAILQYSYNKWEEADATSDITLSIGFQIFFNR
jgi:hypothetical protein